MAHYSGLSGDVYPLHLKPKDDELLSSWVTRLASAHGLSLKEFSNILQPLTKLSLWSVLDIDLGTKEAAFNALLATLSLKCATPATRVWETTLLEFQGRLFEDRLVAKSDAWILRQEVNPKLRTQRLRVQACPSCLVEDKDPYFRRRWRLAFVVICPQHKSVLIDRCPGCGESIQFHLNASVNIDDNDGSMVVCRKCRFDLRDAAIQPRAESEVIEFQEHLLDVARQGYIKIRVVKNVASPTYFSLLYWMLGMLLEKHRLMRGLQSAIFKHYALDLNISKLPKKYALESLAVGTRYELMWLLHRLLLDHPDRYLEKIWQPVQKRLTSDVMVGVWRSRFLRTSYWCIPVADMESNRNRTLGREQADTKRSKSATGGGRRPIWIDRIDEVDEYLIDNNFILPFRYTQRSMVFTTPVSNELKKAVRQLYADGFPVIKLMYIFDTYAKAVLNWIKKK
ncbi:MAG: TniQ family protein [Pyrinomonadaceae bacterium]